MESSNTSTKEQRVALSENYSGKQFEDNTITVALCLENEIVQLDINYYKSTSPISSKDRWNLHKHKHVLPNLAKLVQRYLGILATSVPSECLFSTADNIASDC